MDRFNADTRIKSVTEHITLPAPSYLRLKGLQGSSSQFVVSSVYQHAQTSGLNHLVILDGPEEAAYFHNTLENLTKAIDLFYFPSSYKNKKNYKLLNSSHVMLRTEALTRFSHEGNRRIMVTYPDALFEKVVLPKTLNKNIIRLKTNDELDVNDLMEKLIGFGFERTDFVYEPGQFAMRGGILDIYSFGNDKPYRLELFGNDVDSIRIFDPETQLSERKLLQVTIIPNVETHFEEEEKTSIAEFLPENTIVWIYDKEILYENLLTQEEDLALYMERQSGAIVSGDELDEDKSEKQHVSFDDFMKADELLSLLQKRHIIEFGPDTGKSGTQDQDMNVIKFATKDQPSFNRQFDILIRDLKQAEKKNYAIFLFAENPRQLERLHSIFSDLNAEISFTPIPVSI
ncbi:MAG: transcription-repair coupling factor, partial [Chitinophagaceae bacterium]